MVDGVARLPHRVNVDRGAPYQREQLVRSRYVHPCLLCGDHPADPQVRPEKIVICHVQGQQDRIVRVEPPRSCLCGLPGPRSAVRTGCCLWACPSGRRWLCASVPARGSLRHVPESPKKSPQAVTDENARAPARPGRHACRACRIIVGLARGGVGGYDGAGRHAYGAKLPPAPAI